MVDPNRLALTNCAFAIVTSSAIVFEHGPKEELKTSPQEKPTTPAEPPASAAAVAEGGAKKERKQWGAGEGVPLAAMLQEKTLQMATYAATQSKLL